MAKNNLCLSCLNEKKSPGYSPANRVPRLAEMILNSFTHEKFRPGLQG